MTTMVAAALPLPTPDQAPDDTSGEERADVSLADRLYETLRRRIVLGELPPGSRLPEQRLADELDVSRIPLREAMSRLATDSLITAAPRRSAVVASWSASDVHDLFDARLAIETSAAVRAAQRSGGLDALDRALRRSEVELRTGDELAFAEANMRFHLALVNAAGNPVLSGLMRTISARMTWLFYLTAARDHETACREHAAIVEAVRSGHVRLAESLVSAHIEAGRHPSLDAMEAVLAP